MPLKGVSMYRALHSTVDSYCGDVGCNILPGGRARQTLLPAWGNMLLWISGIDCQNERCRGWDQLNVNWCWRLRTNRRKTDSVDSTQQTHVYSIEVIMTGLSVLCDQHCFENWRCFRDVWGRVQAVTRRTAPSAHVQAVTRRTAPSAHVQASLWTFLPAAYKCVTTGTLFYSTSIVCHFLLVRVAWTAADEMSIGMVRVRDRVCVLHDDVLTPFWYT